MPRSKREVEVKDVPSPVKPKRAPARTIELRENQIISLAMDLAEKQLRDGSASSQVITNFLKLGSTKERLEKQILEEQVELLKAKTDALKSQKTTEELYTKALDAMKRYTGSTLEADYED